MIFIISVIILLIASATLSVLYDKVKEEVTSLPVTLIMLFLAIAVIFFSYYVWFLFYSTMLCSVFTFLPQIEAKTFAKLYFAFYFLKCAMNGFSN